MANFGFLRANSSLNHNYIMLLLLVMTFLIAVPMAVAGKVSTLQQSVAYALENNRTLAVDAQSVEQANASLSSATGHLLPRVDLSTGVARTNTPGDYFGMKLNQRSVTASDLVPVAINNPGYINNYQTRIGVTMPLFQGGALWAGRSKAIHQADASFLKHEYIKQQVIFQTISAYAHVRQAESQVATMKRAVSAAKKRFQDTQEMQKRGILIKSDVMDARVHLLRTTVELEGAKNALSSSKEGLEKVMGLNHGDIALSADEEPGLKVPEMTLEDAVMKAFSQRSDLMAIEQQHGAAASSITESQASFLPHINLVAAQEWNDSSFGMKNRNTTVGATMTMNLFSGGSDAARVRAAQAEKVSLEYRMGDLKQQVRNEVAHAWRYLAESKMRYESESEAMAQSEESLRIKSLRYEQGMASTTDLLDAQVQADSMRVAAIRAKYDVTIAKAALLLAVGMLSEEVIQ